MKIEWPNDRLDYSPIIDRPPLPLPDGAKVVVWPCINVENWVIDAPMPRTVVNPPGGVEKSVPDIPNWAWHEYGQRIAFWRLKKIANCRGKLEERMGLGWSWLDPARSSRC